MTAPLAFGRFDCHALFHSIDHACLAFRPGGLAYVVAFANRGAKDVTQRYVASVLAADKLRDNGWWEETLKPLRKHEVSVLGPQYCHSCSPCMSPCKQVPCPNSSGQHWNWYHMQ